MSCVGFTFLLSLFTVTDYTRAAPTGKSYAADISRYYIGFCRAGDEMPSGPRHSFSGQAGCRGVIAQRMKTSGRIIRHANAYASFPLPARTAGDAHAARLRRRPARGGHDASHEHRRDGARDAAFLFLLPLPAICWPRQCPPISASQCRAHASLFHGYRISPPMSLRRFTTSHAIYMPDDVITQLLHFQHAELTLIERSRSMCCSPPLSAATMLKKRRAGPRASARQHGFACRGAYFASITYHAARGHDMPQGYTRLLRATSMRWRMVAILLADGDDMRAATGMRLLH